MQTYIVTLKEGVDYNSFWTEIEDPTTGLEYIPDRPVTIVHNRTLFTRLCEYALTEAEAEILQSDPRVLAVERPVRDLPNVKIVSFSVQNPSVYGGNFNKQSGNNFAGDPSSYSGNVANSINWGLIAHSSTTNPYGINTTGNSGLTTSLVYNYSADGTGVDVLINDGGLQIDHPEFTNASGNSRVQQVNWNNIAAIVGANTSFNWNTASYTDTNGHGTNVAGIAVGKTYGWAKNSNIFSLIVTNPNVDVFDMFEMLLYWHQNKGNSNPTIVNMSWAVVINFNPPYDAGNLYHTLISGGSYRGNAIPTGQSTSYYNSIGLIPLFDGTSFQNNNLPFQSSAINAALGTLVDAGIIVCQAAGNNAFKIDVPTNPAPSGDYSNYVTFTGDPTFYYYHRGSSPKDPRTITVGALDTLTSSSGNTQRVWFSCAGPGVDIWAAGTYIMSSGSNTTAKTNAPYFLNPSFKEYNLSGTSMASPQVTGVCALYLQANPTATMSQVKSWVLNNAGVDLFDTGNSTSYTNYLSLLGGNAKVVYNTFNTANNFAISNGITLSNITLVNT